MRPTSRELWIISGVLVPFAILVVLGLAWPLPPASGPAPARQVEPGPSPPQTSGRFEPPQPRSPPDDAGSPALAGASRPAPRREADAPSEPHSWYPVELDAPLEAVDGEVQRCLLDQGTRAPRQLEIEVAFRPTRSGTFEAVTVHPSWHDPYLEACVEDVFAEIHWVPSGRETFAPASYTFHLSR